MLHDKYRRSTYQPLKIGNQLFSLSSIMKTLFWLWLITLTIVNVIPLGRETSRSLSSNKVWRFRYDYLVHAGTFLSFGFIWILGSIMRVQWFKTYPLLKFYTIVFAAAIVLESLQYVVPWRTFSPMDLIANLVGAALGMGVAVLIRYR
ncbi:MAG: VanZ family protein [Candidatus Cloacimonetes bacterium]|nr:VanZ family protein [Candidatus Cloacimonadota bacterium]